VSKHAPAATTACICRYVVYEKGKAGYTAKRMPDTPANRDKWPSPANSKNTVAGCPFSVMTDAILDMMKDDAYDLYVTGHRCGTPSSASSVIRLPLTRKSGNYRAS
jgi:hypothetical protein